MTTDRRWRKWELAGLFVTLILGNALHFLYDLSGENPIAAAFSAANESTWEHMKLLIVPWALWSLVEAAVLLRSRRGVLMPRALGLLCGTALIPAVYYTYTGIVGQRSAIADILLFQAAVLLSALISWHLMAKGRFSAPLWSVLGLLLLLGLWALAVWWTFAPPPLPLFTDPTTGTAGVSASIIP